MTKNSGNGDDDDQRCVEQKLPVQQPNLAGTTTSSSIASIRAPRTFAARITGDSFPPPSPPRRRPVASAAVAADMNTDAERKMVILTPAVTSRPHRHCNYPEDSEEDSRPPALPHLFNEGQSEAASSATSSQEFSEEVDKDDDIKHNEDGTILCTRTRADNAAAAVARKCIISSDEKSADQIFGSYGKESMDTEFFPSVASPAVTPAGDTAQPSNYPLPGAERIGGGFHDDVDTVFTPSEDILPPQANYTVPNAVLVDEEAEQNRQIDSALARDRLNIGLCPTCGVKLFHVKRAGLFGQRKIFTPLTTAEQVDKGRCLHCHPERSQEIPLGDESFKSTQGSLEKEGRFETWKLWSVLAVVLLIVIGIIVVSVVLVPRAGGDISHAPSTLEPTPEPTTTEPSTLAPTTTEPTTPEPIFNHTHNWVQVGLDLEGPSPGDLFGGRVSLDRTGTRLLVSARRNDAGGEDSGMVLVYDINGNGTFTQVGQRIIGNPKEWTRGKLSKDGSHIAIGTSWYDGEAGRQSNVGQLRMYELTAGKDLVWTPMGDPITGEAERDESARDFALSQDGSIVAIGAHKNDGTSLENSGHVRVYRYDVNRWEKMGNDIDGEGAGDRSGWAVSLSADGTIVAVGAYENDGPTGQDSGQGQVRVFRFETNNWTQLGNTLYGEAADDWFGRGVSLSSDGMTFAAGAKYSNGQGPDSGQVRVFSFDNSTEEWYQVGDAIDGDKANDRLYGVGLSADGKRVATSSWVADGERGYVRVYDNNGTSWQPVGDRIRGQKLNERFGVSFSLSSDGMRLAVGASSENAVDPLREGVVRLYDFMPLEN